MRVLCSVIVNRCFMKAIEELSIFDSICMAASTYLSRCHKVSMKYNIADFFHIENLAYPAMTNKYT